MDRPQRLRSGRHADRDVRVDDRPAPVPAQPRARPALREVPRADRRSAVPADGGQRRGHVLAVRRRDRPADDCRAGTEVATLRTPTEESINFTTTARPADHPLRRRARRERARWPTASSATTTRRVPAGQTFFCFADVPQADDALYVGLSEAVPRCAVPLRFDCQIEGIGVDPDRPAARLGGVDGRRVASVRGRTSTRRAASTATATSCIHVPSAHEVSVIDSIRAGWVRARVIAPREGQPAYGVAQDRVVVGLHDRRHRRGRQRRDRHRRGDRGVRGRARPAVPAPARTGRARPGRRSLEVATGEGWEEWRAVTTSPSPVPTTSHFTLDATAGEVHLRAGRAARRRGAALVRRGAAQGRRVCGSAGTAPAAGGGQRRRRRDHGAAVVDPVRRPGREPHAGARRRRRRGHRERQGARADPCSAPATGRSTAEDYEQLAREAAPEVARVRALRGRRRRRRAGRRAGAGRPRRGRPGRRPAAVRAARARRPHARDASRPSSTSGAWSARGVVVEPPRYHGVTVVARLRARRASPADAAPGGVPRRAVRLLPPDPRRPRRRRLAVRPADPRRRGVLGAPAAARA